MKLNKRWSLFFIFSLVIFSNTCKSNVGLGGHIDINPPTCQLTFPTESLPIIRNSFTLRGVANDDNVVDKVKVVVKSVDRAWEGALELPCAVERSGEAWQWSVVVNKPETDGSFPLKDGKYNITILAYDKDGKEGKSTSVLIVDNTPPVLFLHRPSSFATRNKNEDISDDYGVDLILKGTAADDSGLSSLELSAYGDGKWEKQEINNVSTSINIRIDSFDSSNVNGIYRKLYGDDAKAGLKTFPCAIKTFDNAKEYDSPHSTGNSEKGNVSSDYYLYENLYNIERQMIFPKYKVQEIYDMLKGSFHVDDKGVVDEEKEAEAKRIIEALKTGKFGNSTKRFKISCPTDMQGVLTDENRALMGLFGLNPVKSPTFEVLGLTPSKIDFNATSFNNVYSASTRTKGGTLNVKISPNLDETPLRDFSEFEFYYCKLSDYVQYFKNNGSVLNPNKEYPEGSSFENETGVQKIERTIKKDGSSYMATLSIEGNLNIGSSYVILVKGKDKDDNPVVIDPSGKQAGEIYAYGIKIIGSGRPSDVKVTKIANYGDGSHEFSDRAFVKHGEDVTFKFTADSENVPITVSYTLKFGDDKKAEDEKTNLTETTVKDAFTIDKSKFVKGQIHTLIVEVTDSNAQTTSKKYSIWCDDKAPEVDVKPFEEFLSVFPEVKGRLYDVGSGVEISDLKVEYTYNEGARIAINVIEENKENGEWRLSGITPAPKEGVYKFYFNVKDKVENVALEKLLTVKYDVATPLFVEVNGVQGDALKEGKRIEFKDFADITKINLSGKIKESNGIASLKIGMDGLFNENNPATYQQVLTSAIPNEENAYSFNALVDLQEQKERVLILKVVDIVGRENTLKVKVLADKTPPEFKKIKLGVTDFTNFTNKGTVVIGSTAIGLTANVFDSGSGVKELRVALNGSPTTTPNDVLPKTFIAVPGGSGDYSIDGLLNLGLGKTPLKFTLYDKFGKEASWNCDVTVENASLNLELQARTADPSFSRTKDASTIEARGNIELSAIGVNTTGSSPLNLVIMVEKDNNPVERTKLLQLFPTLPVGLTVNDGQINGLESGTSSTPAHEYKLIFKPNIDGSDDGRYVFNLNSGTVTKKFVVIVDNKAPSITQIYPVLGATVFDATSDIKISCYDEASGIRKVECEYKVGKIIPMTLTNGSYICRIPTVDVQEGSYTLKIKAEDRLGNSVEIPLPLYYDKSVPTVELQASVPEKMGPSSSSISLSLVAQDSNELKALIVSLVKKDGNVESWKESKNISGKISNENITLDSTKFTRGDGRYLLRIECKDVADNTSKIIEKEIIYDSTIPSLNVNTSFPVWTNTKTYKVEGTATDGLDGVGVRVVKYKVNNGVEQALSGKDNWEGYVELNEGENRLTFFAEDEVKNKSANVERIIKVDVVAPTLDFIEPSTEEKLLAASSSLGRVVVSASDGASGIREVRFGESSNFDQASPMQKVGSNYEKNITSMPPASEYYFWAKDEAGNISSAKKIKVIVDSVLPEVSLAQIMPKLEISDKIYTNKIATVTGTASDNRGIKDIRITDENGQALKGFVKKDWSFEGNKTATFSFSFNTSQYPNNTALKIKAVVEDIAGNTKQSALFEVNIKQETDIPIVTVSSFEKINKTPLIRSNQLSGNVTDDDGIEAMWIQIGTDSYKPIEKQGQGIGFWTWAYNLPPGLQEGSLTLKFKVRDTEGTEFEVGEVDVLKRVKVKGSADKDVFKDSNISFNYDQTPPKFSDNGVRFSLDAIFPPPSGYVTEYGEMGKPLGTNTVLGNKGKKIISVRALAKDKLGLKTATLTLGNLTRTLPDGSTPLSTVQENNFDVIDFNNVDISGVSEGSLPLKIEITDNSGFNQTWQTTCIIDFKEPVVELTSLKDAVYFGEVSLMGKITDEPTNHGSSVSGVDETSITYSIGNSGFVKEHRDGATLLSSIENTSASWTIKIPNIAEYEKLDASGLPKYGAIKPMGSSRIWSIPIYIKGQDKAGNEVLSVKYDVKFDPNGDTPYIDVLSPNNGSVLGGTVVLSGIARVANPASGKTVREVYLQLSESNTFDGTQWIIEGKDYGKNDGEKIYDSSNVLYWNKSFDASDLLSLGVNSKKVYFRLRGKSEGTFGEWTTPREFTISTDVAKFLDVKLVNAGYNENYVANAKWIKGDDYVIKGSVTHSSGIKEIDAKTGFVGSGIQALEQSSESWFTDNKTKFNIPIRTTNYAEKYGYIEFDIEATDGREVPHAKTVYQKILLKYDNSTPSCAIGTPIAVDNARFLSGKFTSSQMLQQSLRSSYRVLVNGNSYEIKKIAGSDGREIELENATDLSDSFYYSVVKEPKILEGDNCIIEGVAEDSGSGIKSVRIILEVNGGTKDVLIDSYSSTGNKLEKKAGNIVTFKAELDTTQVDNGSGTLTMIATDEAGNVVTKVLQEVFVKNSPVRVTNVIFATDLSGNGSYEGDEQYDSVAKDPNVATEWAFNKDNDFRGNIDVSNAFTYKNSKKSYLKVLCVGGYKNIKASLYRVSDTQIGQFDSLEIEDFILGSPIKEVTNYGNPSIERDLELDLKDILSETDDGKGKFILKITDESIGNLWYAGMKIATKIEIGDTVNPKAAIFPFFYNSDKNMLEGNEQKLSSVKYEGDEPKGHIEIAKFDSTEVSSVSGKVILRGFCYDNAKIKTINLTLPKDTKIPEGSNFKRVLGSEVITTTYNGISWSGGLTIEKSNFTNKGHYVEWEYVWDSDRTLCANDVEIKIEVVDFKGHVNGTTLVRPIIKQGGRIATDDRAIKLATGDVSYKYDVLALTDKDEKVYFVSVSEVKDDKVTWTHVNVPSDIENYALYNGAVNIPSMRINVVPYISKVTTSISPYSATSSIYDRTALGRYPCRDDEKINVEGFNFKDAKFYLGSANLGSDANNLTLTSSMASNALEARVQYKDGGSDKTIKSLNNTDDNTKAYNKCPNNINNDLLNNDVFIDVWGFKVGARPTDGFIAYPVLKVSPFDGKVGLAFANGVSRFNMAGFENKNYSSDTNWKSARQFDGNWAQYVFTDFAFDDYGYSYGMATGVDMNKGGGVASYSKFVARRSGGDSKINDYNNYGNRDSETKNGWGLRLENIGTTKAPYTADPDRIQSPSIATVIAGDSSKTTRVYLAYYDAINKHIRYRYGTVANRSASNGEPTYGGQLVDLEGYGKMQEPDEGNYSILAGPHTKKDAVNPPNLQGSVGKDKAGKYVSIGAIKSGSDDVVVAFWYNFATRSLMYAYTDEPRRDDVVWKGARTVDVGGEYVKCAVDGDGGIHVAYYSKGDLKYAYLSSYSSTNWKIATVDSYSLTGTNVSIDLAKDATTGNWVPYIGYYMAGNANARLAYLVGGIDANNVPDGAGRDEKYTGKWEISVIPTQNAIRDYRISIGVWKEPSGTNKGVIKAIPVVAENVQDNGGKGESIVGGNGSINPILGYAIEEGGVFELAQKR